MRDTIGIAVLNTSSRATDPLPSEAGDAASLQQLHTALKRWKFQLFKHPAFPRQAPDMSSLPSMLPAQASGATPVLSAFGKEESQAGLGRHHNIARHGSEGLDCQLGLLETAAELLVKSLHNCNVPAHLVTQVADVFHTAANLAVALQQQQKHPKATPMVDDLRWTSSLTLEPVSMSRLNRGGSGSSCLSNSASNSNGNIVGFAESHSGGWEVLISVAVEGMFRRCFHDERIKKFFSGQDKGRLTKHMCGFLSCALGSVRNTGTPYVATYVWDTHRYVIQNMGAGPEHVDIMCEHLRSTLNGMGVQDDIIEESMQVLQQYKWIFACSERPAADAAVDVDREGTGTCPFQSSNLSTTAPSKSIPIRSPQSRALQDSIEDNNSQVGSGDLCQTSFATVDTEECVPWMHSSFSQCPLASNRFSVNSLDRINSSSYQNNSDAPQPWW